MFCAELSCLAVGVLAGNTRLRIPYSNLSPCRPADSFILVTVYYHWHNTVMQPLSY